MQYRQLGSSDLQISAITLGAWAIGGMFWGGTEESEAVAAIQRSIDLGVTTIDTAPVYGCGHSEELIGKAIRGRRGQVQLLTKFGLRWDVAEGTFFFEQGLDDGRSIRIHKLATRASIIAECEASLRRLGTDYIDLLQHHWPDDASQPEEIAAAFEKLVKDGKIRHAGVSNYSIPQIEALRRLFPLVSDQPPFSMLRRESAQELIPWCREHGLGIVVYSPLQLGLLTGGIPPERVFPPTDVRCNNPMFSVENRRRVADLLAQFKPIADAHGATLAQLVIAWTIAQPGITAALVGARNPRQAAENAAAADLHLSPDDLAHIASHLDATQLAL